MILETGELRTYDNVRRASEIAMAAGADFIKTSTGKVQPAATLPVTLVMLEAIRDYHERTGRMVGMKPGRRDQPGETLAPVSRDGEGNPRTPLAFAGVVPLWGEFAHQRPPAADSQAGHRGLPRG